MRTAKNEEIEVALLRWITEARNQNITLTGAVLQEKAKFFADALGINNFTCSNGWLSRFKERHGIVCKRICGEESAVNQDSVDLFFSEVWPAIKRDYAPRDIFNADETGLFFKAHPSSTLTFKAEKCSGGKRNKERVTVSVACNMDGNEKLPIYVIGKFKKTRCFKRVKTLPVQYTFTKNAWMNKEIFAKWLLELDSRLTNQKRKICIMMDNCTAHIVDEKGLKSIKCVFLPPNTTAKLQPCDQGIIQCLKNHYRKEVIKKLIECFDKQTSFSIDLLEAMCFLRSAWNSVTPTVIKNCFRHAGFSEEDVAQTNETEMDAVIEEAEKRGIISPLSFEDYVQIDDFTTHDK